MIQCATVKPTMVLITRCQGRKHQAQQQLPVELLLRRGDLSGL